MITIEKRMSKKIEEGKTILDIETSGFSKKKNQVILLGLLIGEKKDNRFLQAMIEQATLKEEKKLLSTMLPHLKGQILSFNGQAFDLPFLKERARLFDLPFPEFSSLDYYLWLKQRKKFQHFPTDLKQTSLEKAFGIERKDQITGKEVVDFFKKNIHQKEILFHNEEDILRLAELIPFLENLKKSLQISMPNGKSKEEILLENILVNKDFAFIHLRSKEKRNLDLIIENSFGQIHWQKNQVLVKIPVHQMHFDKEDLLVAVSPFKGDFSNPFLLPEPFLVIGYDGQYDAHNILELISILLSHR